MSLFAPAAPDAEPVFTPLGPSHLTALTLVIVAEVLLLWRYRKAPRAARRAMAAALASGLWSQEVAYHVWRYVIGTWTPQEMLPLHLCSLGVHAGTLALLTRHQALYEFTYFTALVGAPIALVMPDLEQYDIPHFRYWQFFVSHGLVMTVPLWLTFVEGLRPTKRGLLGTMVTLGVHGGFTYLVNRRLGSNYLFINRKPSSASVLDQLPPWPRYLPFMAAAVYGAFVALYLPWALSDRRSGRS